MTFGELLRTEIVLKRHDAYRWGPSMYQNKGPVKFERLVIKIVPEDSKKKFDAFIAKVVNDPAKPPETLLIQGFLGASSEADHTRVYADVTLDSYVDVANADIIHMEPLPKELAQEKPPKLRPPYWEKDPKLRPLQSKPEDC